MISICLYRTLFPGDVYVQRILFFSLFKVFTRIYRFGSIDRFGEFCFFSFVLSLGMLFCLANWDHYIIRYGRIWGHKWNCNRISFCHFYYFVHISLGWEGFTKEKEWLSFVRL